MSSPSFRFSRPGPIEIIVGAVLSLLVGLVLAALFLICKAVPTVEAAPKDAKAGAVYYLPGRKDWSASRRWLFKRDSLLQGHSITVGEDEMNAWLEALYPPPTPPPPPRPSAKDKGKPEPEVPWLQPGTPNFRLTADRLVVSVVCDVNVLGLSRKVVAQAEGGFAKTRTGVVFAPDTLYLGSLPVHRFPPLLPKAFRMLTGLFEYPEDLTKAWGTLTDAKVEHQALVLTVGGS